MWASRTTSSLSASAKTAPIMTMTIALSASGSLSARQRKAKRRSEVAEAKTHEIKVWPAYFKAINELHKNFEVRKNDRNYQVGDCLVLKEFDPVSGYTGEWIKAKITYILHGGQFGIEEGYCVMALR